MFDVELHDDAEKALYGAVGALRLLPEIPMKARGDASSATKALVNGVRYIVVWRCMCQSGGEREDTFLAALDSAFNG